jgi:hypothetical protein
MMESEQRTYQQNPNRRYVEVNPAILALQRVIVRQYEQFVQQSSQLESSPLEQGLPSLPQLLASDLPRSAIRAESRSEVRRSEASLHESQ